MPTQPRFWDGKTVHFAMAPHHGDRRSWELGLTEETARKLALALAKCKQTYFTLEPEVQEILDALNYVLVADPASVQAHQRIEAGKGATPDGGFKLPEPTKRIPLVRHKFIAHLAEPLICDSFADANGGERCGLSKAAHDPVWQDTGSGPGSGPRDAVWRADRDAR